MKRDSSKYSWIAFLSLYSFLVITLFILTILYTTSIFDYNAETSVEIDGEESENGMAIFWFAPFRTFLLILVIIALIVLCVLFICLKKKSTNLDKKNKRILYILFSINAFILFLSFIFLCVLINSIDYVLWNLKYYYKNWRKVLIDKEKNVTNKIYQKYLNKYEGFLYILISLFTLISFYQISHMVLIINKGLNNKNNLNTIVQK